MSTPLKGALDPDCDDELFDCQNVDEDEDEDMNENILRAYIRALLSEAALHPSRNGTGKLSVSLGTSSHHANVSGGNRNPNYQSSTKVFSIQNSGDVEEDADLIDEDELEAAEEDASEVNAISTGGGAMQDAGSIRGVNLPLGMSTPGHGRKRMPAWKANAKAFGGANLAKPVVPGKKKSSKRRKRKK
jgi:hypothetical protein